MADFGAGYARDFYRIVYDSGYCIQEALRRDWGDPAFDAFLADWFEDHRGTVATTAEFDDALREWAPMGFDMDDFPDYARLTAAQ